MKKDPASMIVLGSVAVVIAGLVLLARTERPARDTARSDMTNREYAMICTTDMATQFHIHPTLELIRNGEPEPVPPNIGVRAGCMNPLHTHEGNGTIHVESPEPRDFSLGDFYAVWDRPFPSNARVTVNGRPSDKGEDLVLRDNDRIVISYEE